MKRAAEPHGRSADHYDLIVIGSGPAGEKGAAQAAYFGKRVAMIERAPVLGGAAANTGTLPSKTMRETSVTLSGLRSRDLYGVDLSLRREATVRDLLGREEAVKQLEWRRIGCNIERHAIETFHGSASFVDPHTVAVIDNRGEKTEITADFVLIATGSRPRRPELFAFEDKRIWDSDTILELDDVPHRLAVVGGGVIGSEYACSFAALGVEVTIIDRRERLLSFLDDEVAVALAGGMRKLGVSFIMPDQVQACDPRGDHVVLELSSGRTVEADAVLVAAGRLSNTDTLDLPAAGIKPGRRGRIEVDEKYRTEVSHIYAAGDVIGFPALASTSMEQARLAMVDAFQLGYKRTVAELLPFGIYTIPEVSMVGETEQSAREKSIDFVVGKATYLDNARGTIIGDDDGFLKLLFSREEMKLIGVHVIGEIASELVHIGLMAMMCGATHELFIRACFNYPTLGQLYKYATYDAMGHKQRGE